MIGIILDKSLSNQNSQLKLKIMETSTASAKMESISNAHPELYELFVDGIQDIFWAENHLVKALPKMIHAATSSKLKKALEGHLEETKTHVNRLSEVFSNLGEKEKAKTCEAMKGILEEADELLSETSNMKKEVVDVAIIMAGQKVEHYEIATYSCLIGVSEALHLDEVCSILKSTLAEENAASTKLNEIAENEVFKQSIN